MREPPCKEYPFVCTESQYYMGFESEMCERCCGDYDEPADEPEDYPYEDEFENDYFADIKDENESYSPSAPWYAPGMSVSDFF